MASANVTHRTPTLGDQDDVTGWYGVTWEETTIKMVIIRGAATQQQLNVGLVPKYDVTGYTPNDVYRGDEIKDYWNRYYRIELAEPFIHLNQHIGYVCALNQLVNHADRAATSGTWHEDAGSLNDNPQYRTKAWLDTYLTAANLLEDDGYTEADFIVCFDNADYPIDSVFSAGVKDVDLIFSVGEPTTKPLISHDKIQYGYEEIVPVTVTCVNKSGITAVNLKWQGEAEVRRVAEEHPFGSLRLLDTRRDKVVLSGATWLYQTELYLTYIRMGGQTPDYPRITWGPSASPTGTYIFPNAFDFSPSLTNRDVWSSVPAMSGDSAQALGSKAMEISFTCDLNVDAVGLTWKRPQTSLPKTDILNWQIFADLWHNEGATQEYHTLTLGANGPAFKVRMVSAEPHYNGISSQIRVTFKEYVTTDQSGETYLDRLGIT